MRLSRLMFCSLFAASVCFSNVVLVVPAQAQTKAEAKTGARVDVWREGAPMSTARANAGGVLVGEDLYVIGGSGTSGPRSLSEIYDTIGNIWRAAAPMPVGLEQFGIATDGSRIYVVGGFENNGVPGDPITESDDLHIFDVRTGAWSSGPKMPAARVGQSAASVDGKIYVIGGRGEGASHLFVFDIGTNQWSTAGSAMPSPRSDSAVVVVGKDIYVIGGKQGGGATARVDIYDTERGVWRSGPALPSARDGHVAALLGNEIHVIGGQTISPPKTYGDHFVLDLKAGKWRREASLPTPRHGSIAAVSGGKFIVVGGAPGAGVYTVFTSSDVVDIYAGK